MTPEQKNQIIDVLNRSKSDDLQRARLAFRNYTPEQMQGQWGMSGKTCAEILRGYEEHDSRINGLIQAVRDAK